MNCPFCATPDPTKDDAINAETRFWHNETEYRYPTVLMTCKACNSSFYMAQVTYQYHMGELF